MSVYHVSKDNLFITDDGAWGLSPACLTWHDALVLARVLKGIVVEPTTPLDSDSDSR